GIGEADIRVGTTAGIAENPAPRACRLASGAPRITTQVPTNSTDFNIDVASNSCAECQALRACDSISFKRRTDMKRQLYFLAVLLGLTALLAAQETRGSLSGIVTDGSGAVVPGAVMQLTNMETGVVLNTTSNETGLYRFLFLNPGQYKLVAMTTGFKTFEREHIQLSVSESGTVPVVLEVGAQ